MILNEIIATSIEEVGVSWFDFYSLGHITFGIGVFLFFSLLYTIPKMHDNDAIIKLWLVFIITVGVLIAWELLENIVFIEIGIKFEDRMDSPQNITTDLILGSIGAIGSWIFAYEIVEKDKNIWGYYIFGIIAFAIWLIFFFIGRYITYWYAGLYA